MKEAKDEGDVEKTKELRELQKFLIPIEIF